MRVANLIGNSLTTEPVADVVGVPVDEGDAYAVVKDQLKIVEEDWVGKVARLLERIKYVVVGLRIIQVNAERLLDLGEVQKLIEVLWGGGIFIGVADVIDPAAAVRVIRLFDVGAALVRGLCIIKPRTER